MKSVVEPGDINLVIASDDSSTIMLPDLRSSIAIRYAATAAKLLYDEIDIGFSPLPEPVPRGDGSAARVTELVPSLLLWRSQLFWLRQNKQRIAKYSNALCPQRKFESLTQIDANLCPWDA